VHHAVLQKEPGHLLHPPPELPQEAPGVQLGQDAPPHPPVQQVRVFHHARVALWVGHDGDEPLHLQFKEDLLAVGGGAAEGELHQEVAAAAQGEGLPPPQLGHQVGGDVDLHPGVDPHPEAPAVNLRLQRRNVCLHLGLAVGVGRRPVDVVGGGHHGFHAIRCSNLHHFHGLLQVLWAVVVVGQKVHVDVNHGRIPERSGHRHLARKGGRPHRA